MKSIVSRQNPIFKHVRDAMREHTDEIVIEGPKAVRDAIDAGWTPVTIVSRREPTGLHQREVVFSPDLFDAIAGTNTPQNVLGVFRRPEATFGDIVKRADERLIVALDGVQDPGNVGTIVRLAAAFDAAGVVLLQGTADAYGPKAIRASAGAILNVRVARATAHQLIDTGLPLFATDMDGDETSLPARGAVLVFGSEGQGISDDIAERATSVRILMSNAVESLNVAASAAILLWQSYSARWS